MLSDSVKDKLIEAAIDIGKTCFYVIGGIAILNLSDEKIVNYLDKFEKLKSLREASIDYKSEELEATKRLVRSAKRLQYSTYSLESSVDIAGGNNYENNLFQESASEFLSSLRLFLSYSTELSLRESATSLSQSIESVQSALSAEDQNPEVSKNLKIDLILLNSKLSKLVLTLTQ